MRWLRALALFAAIGGTCFAEPPDFYKKIGRVIWVLRSIDRPLRGWTELGLTGVREFGAFSVSGQYRDKAVAVSARTAKGNLGGLAIDMMQPAPGDNAFNAFLTAHGDGIFSVVHEVGSPDEMAKEVARMRGLGVTVLQTLNPRSSGGPVFTFFDTEPQGKYVLGLVYWPRNAAPADVRKVTHIAFVIRDPAPVSAYWAKLGFPAMPVSHASPREGSSYHGKPLLLPFDVGWHNYSQPIFEWIIPPQRPANC